ncbi:LamG-like jellyroll fold domain-containing protein [Pseudofulvibacter geojedonensis]|uniref:LamG-like jellyroll fold domain-containing protein n=1 Tax=Pseudofulvibacter geojedonensis TaxID=1123758 RepID=A0ABW3I0X3_9FLAO
MKFKIITIIGLLFVSFTQAQINPYLQTPTSNSIWVTWQTDSGTESVVEYGLTQSNLNLTVTGTNDAITGSWNWHKVRLTGLTPNTAYYYRVKTGSQYSSIKRFKTQPIEGSDTGRYRFIVLGDHQRNDDRYGRLVDQAKAKAESKYGTPLEDHVNLIVHTGDQSQEGDRLWHWKDVQINQGAPMTGNIPSITVVGNHDDGGSFGPFTNDGGGIGYYSRLFTYADDSNFMYGDTSLEGANGDNYYAFQVANIAFVCLNSNQSWGAQTSWANNVVTAIKNDSSIEWMIGDAHHPLYAEQLPGDESGYMKNTILPLFKNTDKFAMYLSGHAHLYSRGALREDPVYHVINGGASWDQYWTEYNADVDYEEVQKTIIRQLYQIVDIDLDNREMYVETYSIGSSHGGFNEDLLIDSYYLKLDKPRPDKPSITVPANITLPYEFQGSTYSGTEPYNSTEFQFTDASGNFTNYVHRVKRDYENIFYSPSTTNPTWDIVDLNAGVDIFKLNVTDNQIYQGTNYVRVRYRDQSMHWSDWSDPVQFNATNGMVLSDDPIHYYPLNIDCKDYADVSTAKPTGSAVGSVMHITDNSRGKYSDFDANSYYSMGFGSDSSFNLPRKQISVSAWVKLDQYKNWGGILGHFQDNGSTEHGFLLGYRNDKFSFALRGAGSGSMTYLTDTTPFNLGQWYHVAATYNGSEMKLFVDGQLRVSSNAQSGNISYADAYFQIGSYKDDNEDFRIDGSIDEVYIWEKAKTNAEILDMVTNNYTKPRPQFTVGGACESKQVIAGNTVSFIDNSLHKPNTWNWTFTGAQSTSSTNIDPVVTYNTPGTYPVTLEVTNGKGTEVETVTDYITVVNQEEEVVLHYDFENGFRDQSANGYDIDNKGLQITNTNPAQGLNNYVYVQNSYGDIKVGNVGQCLPQQNFTIATWVNMHAVSSWGSFLGYFQDNGSFERGIVLGTRANRFSIGLSTTGDADLDYHQASNTYNLNQWYWVTATYDGTTLKLFVDCNKVAETTVESGSINYPTNGWLTIGRYKDDNEDFAIEGKLDEILLMKEALTEAQICSKYTKYVNTLSINKYSLTDSINIYPNPSSDIFNIHLPKQIIIKKVKIFSISGRLINSLNEISNSIDLSNYSKGIYLLQFTTNDGSVINKKIIKN